MTPGGSRVPALVAHRLGRAYGPDSSRAALERTLAGPVDGVEMRVLRLAGLSVNTGTINSPELLAAIAPLLPDAVCTDRPHELQMVLETGRAAAEGIPGTGTITASA
jgi:hypothetical protein